VHPDLVSLLALQERDQAVMAAEKALDALRPEEAELDDALELQVRALSEAEAAVQAARDRRAELEARIAGYKQAQERRRQQLEYVRGAKEAATLMADIDLARRELVKEETEFLGSSSWVIEAEKKLKDVHKVHAGVVAQQAEARASLAERFEAARAQLAEAVELRAAAAQGVRAPVLVRYERTRRGRTPVALFPLRLDACSHCNTAVPLQRRQLIMQGQTIEACEGCGVLLYVPE
jgi:predicted  nucleic acid-binding Zn-ribbon protein